MDMLGLYPTFYVPQVGTAWVMGIIGVIHVVASHTSVGASFLFAMLATVAYRQNKPELMEFVRRYGMFLLVFSYIIGSITGPGIWYAITVASPRGVGGLIHNFVWVWAAEWVYFTVEVIGVYALVYLIGKIDAKSHLKLTWSFALASWATMLLIVGILSFMLWPGNDDWYRTGSTNDAFYNLNFFAHLGTRTGSMLVMAAVVGLMVASRMQDQARTGTPICSPSHGTSAASWRCGVSSARCCSCWVGSSRTRRRPGSRRIRLAGCWPPRWRRWPGGPSNWMRIAPATARCGRA